MVLELLHAASRRNLVKLGVHTTNVLSWELYAGRMRSSYSPRKHHESLRDAVACRTQVPGFMH